MPKTNACIAVDHKSWLTIEISTPCLLKTLECLLDQSDFAFDCCYIHHKLRHKAPGGHRRLAGPTHLSYDIVLIDPIRFSVRCPLIIPTAHNETKEKNRSELVAPWCKSISNTFLFPAVAVDFVADGVCDILLKLRDSQSKPTRPFMPCLKKNLSAERRCFCWGWAFFDCLIHAAGGYGVKLALSVGAD